MNTPEMQLLKIDDIDVDDEFNCRGKLMPIDVESLAKDIEANGLHQPVVVMPYNESERAAKGKQYKLLAGFRRTYAHIILKRVDILAVVKQWMDGIECRILNLSENLKRKDLNILQEALALKALKDAGVPRDQVAERVGMSSSWVQSRWAVLDLPDDVQKIAAAGLINQYHMKKLAGMRKEPEKLYATVREIKQRLEKSQNIDDIIKRKPVPPAERRKRTTHEIEAMRDMLLGVLGSNPYSRAMAWVAGGLSDIELYDTVKGMFPEFKPKDLAA